ncbi:MAG TPA: class I SAM-dependent methyltransferase [Dissulfurispiraceae bacterium]|nr:class I SAM-dependent methyltransferase [Dissulfurispiraceae bacterium]
MSVIEYGCGDGNQLSLAVYPQYLGFDISDHALGLCRARFQGDNSKIFKHLDEYGGETADLCLSLDVIYHLIEDDIYEWHMQRLFASASRWVAIYSSNSNRQVSGQAAHVRHRKFSDWIAVNAPRWELIEHHLNPYPYDGDFAKSSLADLYIFGAMAEKLGATKACE